MNHLEAIRINVVKENVIQINHTESETLRKLLFFFLIKSRNYKKFLSYSRKSY